jgi:hypothetical protein
MRVSEDGGPAERLTTPDGGIGETSHTYPQVLPGGRAVLYVSRGETLNEQHVAVYSLATRQSRDLVEGGDPRYVPTGHLVYRYSNTLMAVPFDLARLELSGTPVPIMEGVATFDSSVGGSLVYIPSISSDVGREGRLVWVDRTGAVDPLDLPAGVYGRARISPDGRRVIVHRTLGTDSNLWMYDVARPNLTKFTLDGRNSWPVWSPDGRQIFYASNKVGTSWDLYAKLADGSRSAESLLAREAIQHPEDVTPDGRLIAFSEITSTSTTTWLLSMEDRTPRRFIQGIAPSFSPDGAWVAYASSDESGEFEIYVEQMSEPGGRWQISTTGGVEPLWSPTGAELFYRDGDNVLAIDVQTEPSFVYGNPRTLFEGNYELESLFSRQYDVTADGRRFLMITRTPLIRPLNIVLDWFSELNALVPVP